MNKSRHHLAEVIGRKTLNTTNEKQLAKEIAAYLLSEKQTADIDSLVRDIMQYRADHGIVEAVAVTVSELPSHVMSDVEKLVKQSYPTAKDIVISQRRDDEVIGGIRLDFANEQLDLSVKAKLNKFKRLTAHERNSA
ncbi:MAG: F0F1 ATP synthase subunit delta [Candidatus Saccharimonadales bacterium]